MNRPGGRLGRSARGFLAALALGAIGVLITARLLTPDPRGFGTHMQVGLGPCAFRELTGKPCPACGMTTAFAWIARGRPDRAWGANPAGSVIAPVVACLIPWLAFAAITGKTRPFRSAEEPLVVAVLSCVGMALASWGVRMLVTGG